MNYKYFIFGSDACRAYDNSDVIEGKGVKKLAKQIWEEGGIQRFPELGDPSLVLDAYDGWNAWAEITEQEHNILVKRIEKLERKHNQDTGDGGEGKVFRAMQGGTDGG